jgi:hypothetical protein
LPPHRADELFDTLSGAPRRSGAAAWLYHGARVAVLLGLVVLVQLLFPVASVPDFPVLERGMVPEQDVIAQVTFPLPKSEIELRQEQEEAARSVPPIFHYDSSAVTAMLGDVGTFVAYLDSAADAGGSDLTVRAQMREVLSSYGLPSTDDHIALLRAENTRRALRGSLERAIRAELPAGIAHTTQLDETRSGQLRIVRGTSDQLVARDSVLTQTRFFELAARHVPWSAPAGLTEMQRLALIRFFEPSIRLNAVATDTARAHARAAVPVTKGTVMRGERIVAAHEQVRDADLERLQVYRDFLVASGALDEGESGFAREAGSLIINLSLLSIFAGLLFFYRQSVYQNYRHVLVVALLMAVVIAAAAVIAGTAAPVQLVPIAFAALVVAMLWDGRMALNMSLVLALLLGAQTPFLSFSSHLTLVIGGAAAALSVRVVRRRAQGLMLGAVVAIAYALLAVALGLVRGYSGDEVLLSSAWGAVNGIGSALLALGFMPLFEAFTRITTDQTLLELADLNRPLLKRLSLEASGTYAHSINVANLAEAAAGAIDANALLVRVGAYYHDVGKVAAPQYFIENQARGHNPHDQLDPATSAALVRSHVLEGIKLADQAKLPDDVKRFIPEHHGTQSIVFFLDQARKQEDGVDPHEFAYVGPRPQTRETAILMLADSVESAAKVLQDPTPERLRDLVDRIVDGKIAQHQLDEAPLTLRELSAIKQAFTTVLMGMYHHRIDYPPQPSSPAVAGAGRAER